MDDAVMAMLSPQCSPEARAQANIFFLELAASPDGIGAAMRLLSGSPPPQYNGNPQDVKVLAVALLRNALRNSMAVRNANMIGQLRSSLLQEIRLAANHRPLINELAAALGQVLSDAGNGVLSELLQDRLFQILPPACIVAVLNPLPDAGLWMIPTEVPPVQQLLLQIILQAAGRDSQQQQQQQNLSVLPTNCAASALRCLAKWVPLPNRALTLLELARNCGPVLGIVLRYIEQPGLHGDAASSAVSAVELLVALLQTSRETIESVVASFSSSSEVTHGSLRQGQNQTVFEGRPRDATEAAALHAIVQTLATAVQGLHRAILFQDGFSGLGDGDWVDDFGLAAARLAASLSVSFGPLYLLSADCPCALTFTQTIAALIAPPTPLPVAEALLMGDSTEEGDVGGIEILLSASTASLHPDITSGTNGLRSLLSRALVARCRLPGGTNGGPCWQGLEEELSEAADGTPLAAKNGWGGGTLLDEEDFRRFRSIHARDAIALIARPSEDDDRAMRRAARISPEAAQQRQKAYAATALELLRVVSDAMPSNVSEDWRQIEVCLYALHAASHELMEGALPRPSNHRGLRGNIGSNEPEQRLQPDPIMAPALNSVFSLLAVRFQDNSLEKGSDSIGNRGSSVPTPLLSAAARVVGSYSRFLAAAHESNFKAAAAARNISEHIQDPSTGMQIPNPMLQPPFPLDVSLGGSELRGCIEIVLKALHTVDDSEVSYEGAIALAKLSRSEGGGGSPLSAGCVRSLSHPSTLDWLIPSAIEMLARPMAVDTGIGPCKQDRQYQSLHDRYKEEDDGLQNEGRSRLVEALTRLVLAAGRNTGFGCEEPQSTVLRLGAIYGPILEKIQTRGAAALYHATEIGFAKGAKDAMNAAKEACADVEVLISGAKLLSASPLRPALKNIQARQHHYSQHYDGETPLSTVLRASHPCWTAACQACATSLLRGQQECNRGFVLAAHIASQQKVEALLEKLCEFYRVAVEALGRSITSNLYQQQGGVTISSVSGSSPQQWWADILSPMTETLLAVFNKVPLPCVLSKALTALPQLLGNGVGMSSSVGAFDTPLHQLLESISSICKSHLPATTSSLSFQSTSSGNGSVTFSGPSSNVSTEPLMGAFLTFFHYFQVCAPGILVMQPTSGQLQQQDSAVFHPMSFGLDIALHVMAAHGTREDQQYACSVMAAASKSSRATTAILSSQMDGSTNVAPEREAVLAQYTSDWFSAHGNRILHVLLVGLADNLAEELLPRVADILGPLLHHPRIRPALIGTPTQQGGWLYAELGSERLQQFLPAGSTVAGGLLQQFGQSLVDIPDMITPCGSDMGVRMTLSHALESFSRACRPSLTSGDGD